jgi:diaminopimelate epimerase
MNIQFKKYQGTGNDFILIDNRDGNISANNLPKEQIQMLCDRRFGIGADGFILLNNKVGYDFEMQYYNSDGNESTMCGNGGRCIVQYAHDLHIITNKAHFTAIDGDHNADLFDDKIVLQMKNVTNIKSYETFHQLDTGSPHYVTFVDDIDDINVIQEGALIRNSPMFEAEGINVNFVEVKKDHSLFVRTYERGVEDETLSCGTGVTACALVHMIKENINTVHIETLGGPLSVRATATQQGFEEIMLEGPAAFVFKGEIAI